MEEPSNESPEVLDGWRRDALTATVFLTRLPIRFDAQLADLARAYRAFPLVGLVVGVLSGIVVTAAQALGLPAWPAAFVGLGACALLTGALHEDGLADTADGLGGGRTVEDRLAIMRDSRIGSYGVLALIVVVGAKASALATLANMDAVLGAWTAAAAGSRAAMTAVAWTLDPARADGLGHGAGKPGQAVTLTALALGAALVLLFLSPIAGIAALAVAALVVLAMIEWARRRIGGYTGDVLGATQQVVELAILLAVVAAS